MVFGKRILTIRKNHRSWACNVVSRAGMSSLTRHPTCWYELEMFLRRKTQSIRCDKEQFFTSIIFKNQKWYKDFLPLSDKETSRALRRRGNRCLAKIATLAKPFAETLSRNKKSWWTKRRHSGEATSGKKSFVGSQFCNFASEQFYLSGSRHWNNYAELILRNA